MLDFSFLSLVCAPPAPQQNFGVLEVLVTDCLELEATLKEWNQLHLRDEKGRPRVVKVACATLHSSQLDLVLDFPFLLLASCFFYYSTHTVTS